MAKLSREYFKRLVADHQLDNLIEELFQLLTNFLASRKDKIISDIYDSLILVSGKYKTIKHENLLGIMDSTDSSLELNKIGYSLISIINNIPDLVFDYHSDIENKIESTRDKIKKINASSAY